MAKIDINFNNTNYTIDEASLSTASATLKSHLSTVMNGSGATINLGGTSYGVDSTKLSAATSSFVSHLGTIAGGSGGSDTLYWDGTPKDGIIVSPDDEPMYYISEVVLTENDLINGYKLGMKRNGETIREATMEHSDTFDGDAMLIGGFIYSVREDNTSTEYYTFPRKGLYIVSGLIEEDGDVFFLTIPNYTGFGGGSGTKVTVNGVEYYIDPTKLSGAVTELETVLGGLNSGSDVGGSDTLYWDGNTDGLAVLDPGDGTLYYRVSDTPPTLADFANGCSVTFGGRTSEFAYEDIEAHIQKSGMFFGEMWAYLPQDISGGGMTIAKGIYFMNHAEYGYVTSLTIPNYTGF